MTAAEYNTFEEAEKAWRRRRKRKMYVTINNRYESATNIEQCRECGSVVTEFDVTTFGDGYKICDTCYKRKGISGRFL